MQLDRVMHENAELADRLLRVAFEPVAAHEAEGGRAPLPPVTLGRGPSPSGLPRHLHPSSVRCASPLGTAVLDAAFAALPSAAALPLSGPATDCCRSGAAGGTPITSPVRRCRALSADEGMQRRASVAQQKVSGHFPLGRPARSAASGTRGWWLWGRCDVTALRSVAAEAVHGGWQQAGLGAAATRARPPWLSCSPRPSHAIVPSALLLCSWSSWQKWRAAALLPAATAPRRAKRTRQLRRPAITRPAGQRAASAVRRTPTQRRPRTTAACTTALSAPLPA